MAGGQAQAQGRRGAPAEVILGLREFADALALPGQKKRSRIRFFCGIQSLSLLN
jgi:hypothetical protein